MMHLPENGFRIFLIVLGLLLLYIVIQAIRMEYFIHIGQKLAATAIPFSRTIPHAKQRILVVGDSTGVGTGASTNSRSLAGLVGNRYPEADILNASVNGAKTSDVLAQLNGVTGIFDLILIEIGGNDTVRFTNLEQLQKDLEEVLKRATAKSTRVLLTSTGNVGTAPLFPAPLRGLLTRRTLQVRDIFLKQVVLHSPTVRYTDLYRDADNDPFAKDPALHYAADSFHPSDAGYQDWFTLMSKELDHFRF